MGRHAKIMITGMPGCGKTTLFKKVAAGLRILRPVGFFTEEIRERGVRKGFAFKSFDGREGVLAHVDFSEGPRVGKYRVDVASFEKFLEAIQLERPESGPVMIDEIGRMECLSRRFQQQVRAVLDSDRLVIATIAQHGGGLIAEIKNRRDVQAHLLTMQNRDRMPGTILGGIQLPDAARKTP